MIVRHSVATSVGTLLIYGMFWRSMPAVTAVTWLVPFFGLILLRFILYRRYPRTEALGVEALVRWRYQWNVLAIVSGLFWGVGVWLFYDYGDTAQKTALILTVYAYTLGSIQLLAHQDKVFLLFISAALLRRASQACFTRQVSPRHE